MDYKIKLGNVNFNIPGQASVELKDIELEVTNLKLKDITSMLKEVKNIVTEMRELEKMNHEAQKEAQEREYEHFMNAIAVQEVNSFPTVQEWIDDLESTSGWGTPIADGLDTDGDLFAHVNDSTYTTKPVSEDVEAEIDSSKTAKSPSKKASRVTFGKKEATLGE